MFISIDCQQGCQNNSTQAGMVLSTVSLGQINTFMQLNEFESLHHIKFKILKNKISLRLNDIPTIIKPLEEKKAINPHQHGLSNSFIKVTPKHKQ